MLQTIREYETTEESGEDCLSILGLRRQISEAGGRRSPPKHQGVTMESEIIRSEGGTAFVGPDAIALYRATAIRSGLKMYAKCGMRPNRAWTPTAMLKAAGEITGKTYKRGQYLSAAADLEIWANTMSAALPKRSV